MRVLDTMTITLAGLMVGNELGLSAFVNPAVWQLASDPQAQAIAILARSLGRIMPFWYGLCIALLALESFLHRHEVGWVPLIAATLIWAGAIVFSVTALVPINNRIGRMNTEGPVSGWKRDHEKWDFLHRIRILLLAAAFFALTYALVA